MDEGLALLRLVVGGLLVGHGGQKLFGWFGGYGLRGTGGYLAGLGYRPGVLFAALAGLGEGVGGSLLAIGLLTPLAAAVVVATMVNVYAGHAGKGVWNHEGGWEFPLVLGAAAAALALAGPGSISADAALGLLPWGANLGHAAVAAGLAAGAVALLGRRAPAAERVAAAA